MEQVKNQLNMKQYLKDILHSYYVCKVYFEDERPIDQFISDYLKDHPLPLPTEKDIELAALDELEEDSIDAFVFIYIKYWMRGVLWLRNQIQESLK